MVATRRILTAWMLAAFSVAGALAWAQTQTGKTVRHRKIAEEDRYYSPEVAQAENAMDKKDYVQAETLLRRAAAADPGNYRAWFDLGSLYRMMGRRDEAIAAYRKSVETKADVFESNLNLGVLLAEAGTSPGDAEKYLRAATGLKPSAHADDGLASAWFYLGRVLEKDKPQQALAAFERAAQFRPRDPEPHLEAGLLLERQNHFGAAEKEYQQARQLDPQSGAALAGLVNVYMKSGRLPEAEAALRKLLNADPQNGPAHLQLGRVLAAQGNNDAAVPELQKGLQLAPGDPQAGRELAQVYSAAGHYPQAEAQYRALLQKSPNDAELHHALASVLMRQRSFPEAQAELLAALKLNPELGAAYGDLAVAASENQDYELTLRALAARAKFLPELPQTYFLRATAYDHLKDFRQAAENYRQFLQLSQGKYPDQEWQARHRLIAIDPKKR